SKAEYARALAERAANLGRLPPEQGATPSRLSINEVILAYWRHAETYYRHPGGTPTSEADSIRLALRPLKRLYGHTPADDFDSLALEAVRDEMVRGARCRNRVNRNISRVRRLFRWAASKRLLPERAGRREGFNASEVLACEGRHQSAAAAAALERFPSA